MNTENLGLEPADVTRTQTPTPYRTDRGECGHAATI